MGFSCRWRALLAGSRGTADLEGNFCGNNRKSLKYGNIVENYLPEDYKWPNATVFYQIDGRFTHRELKIIEQAMNIISSVSCVRFQARTNDEASYVRISSESAGCWADTGRSGQTTQLNLGPGCFATNGTALHELMHTLGFLHQHSRPDRDEYVQVFYENAIPSPEVLFNFEIIEPWTDFGFRLPYDFDSIMHYGPTMYSRDPTGLLTMKAKEPAVTLIDQRDTLSDLDVIGINFLYCV